MMNHQAIIPMEEYKKLIAQSEELTKLKTEMKNAMIEFMRYVLKNAETMKTIRTPATIKTDNFEFILDIVRGQTLIQHRRLEK